MANDILRKLLALAKSLLLAAGTSAGTATHVHAVDAETIQEIAPGSGPHWGTLSGLTAHPSDPSRLFAATDADSPPARIIEISVKPGEPPQVVAQIAITAANLPDLDIEAIVAKPNGGFWLASEGGKRNDPPNLLLQVDAAGKVTQVIELPDEIGDRMRKKGFEGIALADTGPGRRLYVALQSATKDDPDEKTRIAEVDPSTGSWRFFSYPLSVSAGGETTGLSEILHIAGRRFAVIERDGADGNDAFKRIMSFDLPTREGAPPGGDPPPLEKRLALDLVPLFAKAGRAVEPEIEGLAMAADGEMYAITDNDNERPTLLLRLGPASALFGL